MSTLVRELAAAPGVEPAETAGGVVLAVESPAIDPAATRDGVSFESPALEHASAIITPETTTRRMLEARQLTKEFDSGTHRLTVLRDVNFTIAQGEFVAIVGPSGSGKTTLLGLLAGLDVPTRGDVLLDGASLTRMTEDARARLRGEKVGFVFQSFQLIPTLTAIENVQVPLELRGESGAVERAEELLERVGLADRLDHFPTQLSGGEQQRVAIARAFVNRPRILFADEPTGNLDGATGMRIVALLEALNRESGSTVVLVTHDLALAQRAHRLIRLADGVVVEDVLSGATTPASSTSASPKAPDVAVPNTGSAPTAVDSGENGEVVRGASAPAASDSRSVP